MRLRLGRSELSDAPSSDDAGADVLEVDEDSSDASGLAATFLTLFLGATTSGAAWKSGTGIAAAFLTRFGAASAAGSLATAGAVWDSSAAAFFLLGFSLFSATFFTVRLRDFFGSGAITVNPQSCNQSWRGLNSFERSLEPNGEFVLHKIFEFANFSALTRISRFGG